ncbi:PepSY domain-containing protein [Sphingobacterium sp. SRCM116780]|uniref:PepSY-associated TM helix domain-containing protein n=1 Tax=Sphingobacterium sp. SRCM116780 TaxID=2907623 RepID=UPI001F2AAEB3|nr:PepSY-associated TM helix domain-containing protein [Sphingobacterium sp. SRCM116780]UIR57441.1 PepSY domain-containing protein [Sphingobacterium sp. SRCM116780]
MIKKAVLWVHKWLGIMSGIVVLILSLTGCIYTFHDELKLWVYPEKYFITTETTTSRPLALSHLIRQAQASLEKGEKISRVDLYPTKNRTWIFRAVKTDEQAFGHWNYYTYYKRVFVNPYTGEVQTIENSKTEFFQVMLQLHLNLLLGKKYGNTVVAWSTAIFVLILLTGIVLWWPKKWKGKKIKRSFWLDSKVKWKRLNHDLHNVIGFYSLLFALVLGITGLVFAFPGFKKNYIAVFNMFETNTKTAVKKPKLSMPLPTLYPNVQDNAFAYTLLRYPTAQMLSIRLKKEKESEIDIQVRMNEKQSGQFEWLYFDQTTASLQKIKSSKNLPYGDKLGSLNYDIHTGNIGGMPTKILAFVISLLCASLPITGYMIWINKMGKKKKRN